jgi:hypothetical protein
MRTILVPALLAALAGLLTASQAHAYGAATRSATYYNPNTGRSATATQTAGYGPNGAASHTTVSGSGPNGSYSASGSKAYSPTMYGGYSAGGTTGYGASVSRSAAYYP